MSPEKSNIVLIGMAGCGKSSVGKLLAQKLDMLFLDTDDLIVESQNRQLQEIIDTEGPMGFRRIEEGVLKAVDVRNHVIATGGSSIYSDLGIEKLKDGGILVLLQAEVETLKARIGDSAERGLVKKPGQNFDDLFVERSPLYEKHAEITVECSHFDHEKVCRKIVYELHQNKLA